MAKLKRKYLLLLFAALACVSLLLIVNEDSKSESDSIFGQTVFNDNSGPSKKADPRYQITWPADHASHDEFDIEWWYLTANLEDKQGEAYGMQWTLFRFRNPSETQKSTWANEQVFMAHASIHSMDSHWFAEKFARGGVGNAGVTVAPFSAFIDDWQWQNTEKQDGLFPATLSFTANKKSEGFKTGQHENKPLHASFTMQQSGPFILHGNAGYSIKSAGGEHASHYYSAPFIDIQGEISTTDNQKQKSVKTLKGQAWYDHEWTSQLLDTQTLGWDWLSLHLDDGSKIMAFRMRLGDMPDYITGSYISSEGQQLTLTDNMLTLEAVSMTSVQQKEFPLHWKLSIPSKNVDLEIQTLKDDQYNTASVPYYEGMVEIKGSHKGRGFLELTGY